jgi:hypothetical protein
MTKKPAARAETPLPMPHEGGSWIRQPDGSLLREPPKVKPAPAAETPVKDD